MRSITQFALWLGAAVGCFAALPAAAQSFRVQCPNSTITHPSATNNTEPAYTGPTQFGTVAVTATPRSGTPTGSPTTNNTPGSTVAGVTGGYVAPTANVNGAIKCQQVSGGDGYSTMANGAQTFMFAFGPLSGLSDIALGHPGTEFPSTFNTPYSPYVPTNPTLVTKILLPGDPATTDGIIANTWPTTAAGFPLNTAAFTWNGAVGLAPDEANLVTIYDISQGTTGNTVYVQTNSPVGLATGSTVVIAGSGGVPPAGYDGTWTITAANYIFPAAGVPGVTNYGFPAPFNFTFNIPGQTGLADVNESQTATASTGVVFDGHVDPRQIMDIGVMNGSIPAPLIAFDEDDEFFLTLTNVGMIMRPDLFEQHTIHFHGYPNAASFYDGVPDASIAISIGGSFSYYYLAPDAGTYFWHCHIAPPEHLQMGMVGQLYVRPRQNRIALGGSLRAGLTQWEAANAGTVLIDPSTVTGAARTAAFAAYEPVRKRCGGDIICTSPIPPANTAVQVTNASGTPSFYAYNDGDGSTRYDVEYPIQIHGFDPNFHFIGMTFNAEDFFDMKNKYFTLNGRSYPDTVGGYVCTGSELPGTRNAEACANATAYNKVNGQTVVAGTQTTQSSDGTYHASQPLPAVINIPVGGKALLRISDLDVTEYQTLASLGIPMHVIGFNARLLRDMAGNNTDYYTNSITLGGGESIDVILDASNTATFTAGQKYYLFTPQLDHLSNDAENFGGLMTEVNICGAVDPITKVCS